MYIVIVGCGRLGYQLAKTFLAIGHEVLVIEKDPHRCEHICEEMGSVALQGDGSEVRVLREAGLSRTDVLIATTGRDEDNLAACQLARELFSTPKTIAVVNNPQNEVLYKLLGVDIAVNGTQLMLSAIEEEIPGRPLVHLMNLREMERELVSVRIPPDAAVAGKALAEVSLPPNSFISLVIKEGGPLLPDEELRLEADDEVVAVTSPEEEQLLWETLTGVE